MLKSVYANIAMQSQPAAVIASIAAVLFVGYLAARLTKPVRLPNVTAYILAGILIGPFCLDMIPESFVAGTEFLPDVALAFIAFSTGEFFRFSTLKKNGVKVVVITIFEACLASVLVFVVCSFILRLSTAFSVVLAALASATAPASTIMTIRQTKSKGDFVDTLLQVVALDDIAGLVLYSVAISIALASASGRPVSPSDITGPVFVNLGVLLLGGLFGLLMRLFMAKKHSTDNRLIVSVALLLSFCGICAVLNISPLLGCMSMGTVYINLTDDDKLFKQLNYFSPPILLMFFVRSGLSFRLDILFSGSQDVGGSPLLAVGVLYFFTRIIGKYLGALAGCALTGKSPLVSRYLGLALIPQAGIAIGLAALGARVLGGDAGAALNTIILASSVLYELIGPSCAKLALYLSKSYCDNLEDIVQVSEVDENNVKKTELELLIERIGKIQQELPPHNVGASEEEAAFNEAAQEFSEPSDYIIRRPFMRNNRR